MMIPSDLVNCHRSLRDLTYLVVISGVISVTDRVCCDQLFQLYMNRREEGARTSDILTGSEVSTVHHL